MDTIPTLRRLLRRMTDVFPLNEREIFSQLLIYVLIPIGFGSWVAITNSQSGTTNYLLLSYASSLIANASISAIDWLHLCKHFYRGLHNVLQSSLPSERLKVKVILELVISLTSIWITWNTLLQGCRTTTACPCEKTISYLTVFTFVVLLLFVFVKFVYTNKSTSSSVAGDCCICLQSFCNEESGKLGCGHRFHKHCIMTWFMEQTSCPLCRADFTEYTRNENNERGLA